MAYHRRPLHPAPLPPLASIPLSGNGPTKVKSTSFTSENGILENTMRTLSISNISRISNSNNSTDSTIHSSSIGSCNSSNGSAATPPQSISPTSPTNYHNPNQTNHHYDGLLDEFDINKIEMFYRSHRTFVYVGQCLVTLSITETELVDGGRLSRPKSQDWKKLFVGVPVLIFNRGDTKSRDKRQITICLAEHGSGFQLWSDIIDNLSNYQALKPTFHTMYLSSDHRKMVGFNFSNQFAALEFYQQIEMIVANPLNISLSGPNKNRSKRNGSSDSKEQNGSSASSFRLFRRPRSKSVGRTSDKSNRHRNLENSALTESPYYDIHDFINSGNTPPSKSKYRKSPNKSDISAPCLFQHVTSINLNIYDPSNKTTTVTPLKFSETPTKYRSDSTPYSTPLFQSNLNETKCKMNSSTSA